MNIGGLETAAEAWVILCLACTALIAIDVIRRPLKMGVMNLVWPITALYAGPLAAWGYLRLGRGKAADPPPLWRSSLVGATHCGSGCAIGDFIGEWLVFLLALELLGSDFGAKMAAGFALAYLFGLGFQFFSIAPMRGLGVKDGLIAAAKADTLSLIAYEVGMFLVMGLARLLAPGLEPVNWTYWLVMDGAMIVGLFAAWPVNAWLIRKGLKEAM